MYFRSFSALTLSIALAAAGCTTPTPVNNLQPTAPPSTPLESVANTPLNTPEGNVMCTNPAPWYPKTARALGKQGNVVLRLYISEEGYASDVKVVKSSGTKELDQAAVGAARTTRCIPYVQGPNRKAAPIVATTEYRFQLDDVPATAGAPSAPKAPAAPQR
jgi:protein TonB